MTLAPGAIIVNASGCFLDWLITRAWGRVMLLAIPGSIGVTLIVMSVWGSLLSRNDLAAWYLDLGEKELEKVDGNWAFGGKKGKAPTTDASATSVSSASGKASSAKSGGGGGKGGDGMQVDVRAADKAAESKVPRFAEAVFRRAQQLQPDNKRIVFVIAAMLAQRGSFAQATAMLKPDAPDEKEGYPPAHALMADMILQQQPIAEEQLPILRHHLQIAPKWDRTPAALLYVASQFAQRDRNYTREIELLKQAALEAPVFTLEVLNVARRVGNSREAEQAGKKAEIYFRDLIAKGEDKPTDRLALVQVLATPEATDEAIEEATRILEEGLQKKESAELRRGLSEIWRLKFSRTIKPDPINKWTYELWRLDHAMQIDPANPGIAEEVAKLARLGGDAPSESLVKELQDILAQGVATPLTHVWLSEAHMLRGEYKEAVYHLNKVILRMPNAAGRYRNNLAYAMVLADSGELEKALEHAKIAVTMEPQNADFRDTLGFVFMKMKRISEAITQLEIAVELSTRQNPPQPRADFHERLAEAYKLEGNPEMAERHAKRAEEIAKSLSLTTPATNPSDEPATNSPEPPATAAGAQSDSESPAAGGAQIESKQVELSTDGSPTPQPTSDQTPKLPFDPAKEKSVKSEPKKPAKSDSTGPQ